ncbi:O-acyltransferase like protein isoform X2 [Ptiloglossa arizonensis]|uniref:O-acyltransferase like protein isoform X2 n=1 Tax=Ptiloglossa arizonensis TaxID=3350558 RepID=UPI003FA07549
MDRWIVDRRDATCFGPERHARTMRFNRLFPVVLPFLLLGGFHSPVNATDKPETVLLDFLAKPFAPLDGASEQCLEDSAIYLEQVTRYAPWALQMYDASVKIPSGVITGNYKLLGNYDECLRARSGHGFAGKACTAMVQFDVTDDIGEPRERDLGDLFRNIAIASGTKEAIGKTVVYEWMWCVPSTCNHTEIQDALEIALDPLKVEGRVDMVVNVPENSCHTAETDRPVFDVFDWIYISILATFAVIVIASTSYDIAKQGRPSPLNRKDTRDVLLTSFSVYTNGRNLLRTDRRRDSIRCLDGLRYLSICWIICGHTLYCEVVGIKINLNEIPLMHLNWGNMFLLNANLVTDTFFLLSGVLMAYTAMTKNEKNPKGRFDVIGLYLHRYVRLTPAYAMMIGFYATLFYKLGTGPQWHQWVGANKDYCRENWWTNLLYVNNYVNLPRMCLSQSWYLATDMQLVWLSPIFLYPMLRFTREIFFWLIIVSSLVISVLVPFVITFVYELPGTMLYYKEYGSYVAGLGLGYILYKTQTRVVKIRSVYAILGWVIAVLSGFIAIVGPRWMYFEDHPYDKLEASFYAGLHRQAFVFSVSWIIFCSVHGYAGFLGRFLSWKGWVPFGRLTYSAFLCHYVFLLMEVGTVRTTGIISPMSILRSFCSNLCLTMGFSALWSVCFEMPFMTLDRALLSRGKSLSKSLAAKSNQGNSFTDSSKEIYRSTNELSSTISRSCEVGFDRKSNAGDNVTGYRSNSSQDSKSLSKDEQRSFVFVIGGGPMDDDSWSKARNVHRNNGFDADYTESADTSRADLGNEASGETKKTIDG